MIARIERGDVNPTITLMWKLADGFGISFNDLMYRQEPDIRLIKKGDITPVEGDSGRVRKYPVLPNDPDRKFEKYIIELDSAGSTKAAPSPSGAHGYLTVYKGSAAVEIDGKKHKLSAGDTIRFRTDSDYSYSNIGKKSCRLGLIIYYPGL
jgi:transcriptional regulator with XRE-family HTH domain